jgi:hypothetical protein
VAILRKAEEFFYTHNPSPHEPYGVRRGLELAAGRMGLKLEDYEAIVRSDPEIAELQRLVIEDAKRRA